MSIASNFQALALIASLLLIFTIPTGVFAQDEDDGDNMDGGIFANEQQGSDEEEEEQEEQETTTPEPEPPNIETTATGQPLGYQDVAAAEVIDDNQNVINPGGAGNANISLPDDQIATPAATNLQETVNPPTIQSETFSDLRVALQSAQPTPYSIAAITYVFDANQVTTIIVKGTEGIMNQPGEMSLNDISARYGYYVDWHEPVDGAWMTVFKSATGN